MDGVEVRFDVGTGDAADYDFLCNALYVRIPRRRGPPVRSEDLRHLRLRAKDHSVAVAAALHDVERMLLTCATRVTPRVMRRIARFESRGWRLSSGDARASTPAASRQ